MIARYKRMRGYDVFYPFGFDDNGLPTERLVEKDSGIRAADMPGSLFREKCMETIVAYEADFKSMWQRLGLVPAVSDGIRRYPPDIPEGFSGAGKAEKGLQERIAGIMVYPMPDLHRPGGAGNERAGIGF